MPKRSPGSRSADDINKDFGARLRFFRETAGRSQTDVGQALAVSFQQVQKYENGTTSISLNRLDELARFFNVSVGQLIEGLGSRAQAAGVAGFAEAHQAAYDDGAPATANVGPLSKDAVSLLNAFNRIRSRKLRRSILTMVEAYQAEDPDAEGAAEHD